MTTINQPTRIRALFIQFNSFDKDDYLKLSVVPVTCDVEGHNIRNIGSFLYEDESDVSRKGQYTLSDADLKDFCISGIFWNVKDSDDFIHLFENMFEVSRVKLTLAKRLVRTLTYIERKYDNTCKKNGVSRSFGEYVARFARILHAQMIILEPERLAGHSYDTGDASYIRYTVEDGEKAINDHIYTRLKGTSQW